ncbi:MAG: HNH endonuclease [Thermoplasmata archaeon]|nr:HNH endonuclease [Thermoplasmata archaeon]
MIWSDIKRYLKQSGAKQDTIDHAEVFYIQRRIINRSRKYGQTKKVLLQNSNDHMKIFKIIKKKQERNRKEYESIFQPTKKAKRQKMPQELVNRIYQRDGYRCQYSYRGACAGPLQIDHIIPVSRGGSNDPRNLQVVCRHHNKLKGAKYPWP